MVTITDWIVALGTAVLALLAIAAIFQDKIRSYITRPVLHVAISTKPPDSHKTRMRYSPEYQGGVSVLPSPGDPRSWPREQVIDTYYFRLRVSNSGNQKAESVEVFATELRKQQADQTYSIVESFLPMNLVWSHYGNILFPAISPETYKHCDLLHVLNPKGRETVSAEHRTWPNIASDRTVLSFDTAVKPYTLSHLVPHGKYHLDILVSAANAKVIKKTLEIILTGEWYDEETDFLSQGIGITLL